MTLRIATWTLQRIADAIGGELVGDGATRPTHISSDTRSIAEGALFVALAGPNFDGHEYVDAAREAGAAAALVSKRLDVAVPQIVVEDTLRGLQRLAAELFREARDAGQASIALTGSNGKTTTKELLGALWGTVARTHTTPGNLNNHIGVPLTICATRLDDELVVIEMGANRVGDIAELVAIAPADVRVIISIGAAHVEGFGGLDGIRTTKAEIFEGATAQTLAVVPASEAALVPDAFPGEVLTVGEGGDIRYQRVSGAVRVFGEDWSVVLRLALPGAHNAHNLATAVATMVGRGVPLDAAAMNAALDALVLPGGRWREVRHGDWIFLDDAYNANPSSVQASWDAFVEMRQVSSKVVNPGVTSVIGEMFELGAQAEALHRETARWVARRGGASAFVFVGAFAEQMAEAAREVTHVPVQAFAGPAETAQWLLTEGPTTVYLKASRGQKLESLIEIIQNHAPQSRR